MTVKNLASEIEKVLHLDSGSCRHEGNFQFIATLNGHRVLVNTEPADDEQEYVNIYSMEL